MLDEANRMLRRSKRLSISITPADLLLTIPPRRFAVLDEADRMLSVGFDEDVERILENSPTERQTLLFSATMPMWVKRLTRKYQRTPVTVDLVGDEEAGKMAETIRWGLIRKSHGSCGFAASVETAHYIGVKAAGSMAKAVRCPSFWEDLRTRQRPCIGVHVEIREAGVHGQSREEDPSDVIEGLSASSCP